jgi:hypothetical protein
MAGAPSPDGAGAATTVRAAASAVDAPNTCTVPAPVDAGIGPSAPTCTNRRPAHAGTPSRSASVNAPT